MYDAKEYWQNRGKTYFADFKQTRAFKQQERDLISFMQKIEVHPISVLEMGCGFGRITKLLADNFKSIMFFDAMDLSAAQIENARKYMPFSEYPHINFYVKDIAELPPFLGENNGYDLVVAVEVLMHIPPDDVKAALKKLLEQGMSLIHIDYWQKHPIKLAEHNFQHDYLKLYKEVGANLLARKVTGRQIIDLVV